MKLSAHSTARHELRPCNTTRPPLSQTQSDEYQASVLTHRHEQDPKQGARVIEIPVARGILGHLKSNGYDELDTARIVCHLRTSLFAETIFADPYSMLPDNPNPSWLQRTIKASGSRWRRRCIRPFREPTRQRCFEARFETRSRH